jgi:predicted transcriptional regulator
MTQQNDGYQKIAEMWGFPESESFKKMLEALMTPEDATLLLECTTPVTVAELAKKLNVDEKSLAEKLDSLFKRGLIFKGKTQYQFRRGRHFGFAGTLLPKDSESYRYWMHKWADENPTREVSSWIETFKKTGNPIHRVYPSRLAIKSNPAIKKEDLLWHEDIDQIFQKAEILIAGPCGCRAGGGMAEPRQEPKAPGAITRWNCFNSASGAG